MPRYRRASRSRSAQNTVWQSLTHQARLTVDASAVNDTINGVLFETVPSVGGDTFEDEHILERIRGAMCHNGDQGSGFNNTWFPFSLAMVKVPAGLTIQNSDAWSLFDNSKADDYIFRVDHVCDASLNNAAPNWHLVDSKAKRKFAVGDRIVCLWSVIAPTTTEFVIDVAVNMRVLWKLRD